MTGDIELAVLGRRVERLGERLDMQGMAMGAMSGQLDLATEDAADTTARLMQLDARVFALEQQVAVFSTDLAAGITHLSDLYAANFTTLQAQVDRQQATIEALVQQLAGMQDTLVAPLQAQVDRQATAITALTSRADSAVTILKNVIATQHTLGLCISTLTRRLSAVEGWVNRLRLDADS